MTAKSLYRKLCENERSIPFFSQAWWLDATAGNEGWDVAIVERGGRIIASLPYVIRRRFGFTKLGQPPLSQTLGPWLRIGAEKHSTVLSRQKELLEELIQELPEFSQYEQRWHYSQKNWLPFYWKGFEQTTRYTYVIPDLSDPERIWHDLRSNIRTDILKARDRENIQIRTDLGMSEFVPLNNKVFARQGLAEPYTKQFLERVDQACLERNRRKIFIAEDSEGRRHAGVYLVWDDNSAYYLMGGGDPALRNSGATSLCMWEAINFAAGVTKSFDFEGSMIEPIERFFRAFGGVQTPYFSVSKTNSKPLKVYRFLRRLRE